MLVFAAIGVFGAGMLAIAAGIPIKEFGFGNTLILSGVLAWCTSAIMVTLWICFRDLKQAQDKPGRITRSGETDVAASSQRSAPLELPSAPSGWPESIPERAPTPPVPTPSAPPPAESRAPRRNLLFASNRKPREPNGREANPREPAPPAEALIPTAPIAGPLEQRPPALAEEARPAPRRIEAPPPARTVRPVSTINPRDPVTGPPLPSAPLPPSTPLPPPVPPPAIEPGSPPPREAEPVEPPRAAPPRTDANMAVSVLKSGVVDGMAYWLYSDGSIEAQMPEGMMRFTSIDELRAHLDKRA